MSAVTATVAIGTVMFDHHGLERCLKQQRFICCLSTMYDSEILADAGKKTWPQWQLTSLQWM